MKKIILSFLLITINLISLKSQCVISSFAPLPDSTGIAFYPNPYTSLGAIKSGVQYNKVIQIRTDSFAFGAISIYGTTITSVNGLPSGIVASYNPANGQIPWGGSGCILLSGICNNPSVFDSVYISFSLNTSNGIETFTSTPLYLRDSICHANASFSLVADTGNVGNFTAYDYSTGSGTLNYLWDFGDGTTDNTQYPTHTYTAPGQYVICLNLSTSSLDPNNTSTCSDIHCDSSSVFKIAAGFTMSSLTVKPSTVTGLKSISNLLDNLSIYPNPLSNELFIDLKQNTKVNYTLTDALGREILKGVLLEKNNRIDVSSLPKSYYQLTLTDTEQKQLKTFKLVK